MKSAFEKQLDDLPVAAKAKLAELPLTHLTDWATFLAIVQDGKLLSKKPCRVYGGLLVYTFYGRPAYRFNPDGISHHLESYSPVCLLLKSDLASKSQRVLPFDSGAFTKYKAAMHSSLDKEHFELPQSAASAVHLLERLWGSNLSYYKSTQVQGIGISATSIALAHYYNLISNTLSQKFDERCSTIEVQLASPVSLKDNVLAIVVPSGVASNEVAKIARDLGADLLVYPFDMPYYIGDFHASVRSVVRDYFESKKWL